MLLIRCIEIGLESGTKRRLGRLSLFRFTGTYLHPRIPGERVSENLCYVLQNITQIDRHRGSGYPLTPATPPCIRVRTRRFESVTLALVD